MQQPKPDKTSPDDDFDRDAGGHLTDTGRAQLVAWSQERGLADSAPPLGYDVTEGDVVTLPNGTKVEVEQVSHDERGTFFTCTEDGEGVFYYTDILAQHPDNATSTATCRHCDRSVVMDDGRWVDPEATGDDSVWRETCDANDEDRVAAHEVERTTAVVL